MEGLINSINYFNDFCENYPHLQQLDLNQDILLEYKQLVDNIIRNLANTPELPGYFVLLYTESFFDALNNIQLYRQCIPGNIFNYDRFINAFALDNNYYTAISHENGASLINSNRQSGSHLLATLADGRAYMRNTLPPVGEEQPLHYESICEERPVDSPDRSFNLENNIIDGYSTYAANLIKKEFVELRRGEELNIIDMIINNKKFFNKITLLNNVNNTILDENLFNLTRERLENNRDLQFYRNPDLLQEMIRSFNIGLQRNDPDHWGINMNSTIIYNMDAGGNPVIVNSPTWVRELDPAEPGKVRSQFNALPDNFFTDHIEYGAIFLNVFQRNNSAWRIYMPLLRTGFSCDLSNNSTISYSHKFSHELFAGGYQTLGFGPLFFDIQQQTLFYNHDLLNTFSLNYRSSTVINQLISEVQRVDANHITTMTNNPNHNSWRNRYNFLMERFHSIIKSVELVCNIGTGIENNINGILPLIHKLPLFHGSNINLFGDLGREDAFSYVRGFLSCTTTIDTAFRFTDDGEVTYIYLILIEPGEHCPFINMGNFFREFALPPGTILHRLGSFRLPDLDWNVERVGEKLGNQIEYVLVRPAIGNFVAEFTNLINIANTWQPYLRSRTCIHNHANVFNQNANIAQSVDALRNNVLTRIPPNNLQIGGLKKRKNNKNANLFKKTNVDLSRIGKIKVKRMRFSLAPNSNTLKKRGKSLSALKKKKLQEQEEHSHFNSFANNKLFETFGTKYELKKYILKINIGFNENIEASALNKKDLETKYSNFNSLRKNQAKNELRIPRSNKNLSLNSFRISKSNKILPFNLIETKMENIFNAETNKILNLKKF